MASPRRVVPGATYLITRRCSQRTIRLRPADETTAIFKYCLALALKKTGVELHAVCVMSNHHHIVVTDRHGVLPKFLQELHRSTAKAINALQRQRENLWSAEKCNAVLLQTDDDILDKMAYVAANPVAAGLVAQPEEWPGLIAWEAMNEEIARPPVYFADAVGRARAPERLVLRVLRPASQVAATEWPRRLRKAIEDKITEAHRSLRAKGRRFLGRAGVLSQSFIKRATSFEPRRVVVPEVAAKDPVVRGAMVAVRTAFRAGYQRALALWRAGNREVAFPYGTWWMRVFHGAPVEPAPAPR